MAGFQPGDTIGPFRIERELGRGAMGMVFLAQEEPGGREVAVKVLAPHLAAETVAFARFQREAQSVAGIHHPGIAAVYEWGEEDGSPYIAFEYVHGNDLARVIRDRAPLPPEEAARAIGLIAGALDTAHATGVFHRDVKPSNIILREDGHPVLVDFGLAFATSLPAVTASASLLGTPAYMAPENVKGDPVQAPADQYSLAVVAFEMLTGQLPFDAPTPYAVLHRQLTEPPPAVTERNPALPAAIDDVLERALAKDPAARYPSCAAFAAALQTAIASPVPARAAPANVPRPSRRPARRWSRRQLLAAGGGGVAAMATAGGLTAWLWPRGGAGDGDGSVSLDGSGSWRIPGGDFANTNRVEAIPAVQLSEQFAIPFDGGAAGNVVVGGGWAVFAQANGIITLVDIESEEQTEVATGATVTGDLVLAEQGDELAVFAALDDSRVVAYGLARRDRRWPAAAGRISGGARRLAPAPSGALWVTTPAGGLVALDPDDGAESAVVPAAEAPFAGRPAFSGDLAFLAAGDRVLGIEQSTLQTAWATTIPSVAATALTVGESLAWVGLESGSVAALTHGGELRWRSTAYTAPVAGLATDGSRLFVSHSDGMVRALQFDGAQAWEHMVEPLAGPPIVDGESMLLLTATGKFCVLATGNGEERVELRLSIGDTPASAPIVAGGGVFVLCQGNLRAYAE